MLYKMDGGLAVSFYAALNGWRLRFFILDQTFPAISKENDSHTARRFEKILKNQNSS